MVSTWDTHYTDDRPGEVKRSWRDVSSRERGPDGETDPQETRGFRLWTPNKNYEGRGSKSRPGDLTVEESVGPEESRSWSVGNIRVLRLEQA